MVDDTNSQDPALSDEMIAAFLDGNLNEQETDDILESLSWDANLSDIISLSPIIDAEVESSKEKVLPMNALAAANEQNMCSFDCELFILRHLDFDIDHWSLLETAKANNWLRDEGTPLHHVGRLLELKGLNVSRKYDASPQDLSQALDRGEQVIIVLDRNRLRNDKPTDSGLPSYHALYVTSVEEDGALIYLNLDTLLEEVLEKGEFEDAWKASGNYMVSSFKGERPYNPLPIAVEDIILNSDLEELTEAIAENAHDIWARQRMDEGWTYGPVRDDAQKKHPDLVPYSQLPESEKEYDRLMAMNTLRLVRRLGFDIIPKQNVDI